MVTNILSEILYLPRDSRFFRFSDISFDMLYRRGEDVKSGSWSSSEKISIAGVYDGIRLLAVREYLNAHENPDKLVVLNLFSNFCLGIQIPALLNPGPGLVQMVSILESYRVQVAEAGAMRRVRNVELKDPVQTVPCVMERYMLYQTN
ncbi:hypothetical protein SDJN02_17439, partial [Cucurbita argyrosperma subsp. argyrosperma]